MGPVEKLDVMLTGDVGTAQCIIACQGGNNEINKNGIR